jgi:hypothetical protein
LIEIEGSVTLFSMKSPYPVAQCPLILRSHRLMDAFAKSDDERDFYLDKVEGFLIYVDLDKTEEELVTVQAELGKHPDRYSLLPKMTFYEIKKFMEGFIHEKVYDIDTKEKLLDIISQKEARENFLEFIYDHLAELEKWQTYYQERSRIRIIEWLRTLRRPWLTHSEEKKYPFFVFEEDLEINKAAVEKLKRTLFEAKVPKDVQQARDIIVAKGQTYQSHEATHPKAKRGRPPKAVAKVEIEMQVSLDIYTQVPPSCRPFLYLPDITSATAVTFSSKFETEEQLLATLRGTPRLRVDEKLEALSQRLESLRQLSNRLSGNEKQFGIEKTHRPIAPFLQPKFKEAKAVEVIAESPKIEDAIAGVIPKKRGRPRKEEETSTTYAMQPRRRFAIKKVSQIKHKKEK